QVTFTSRQDFLVRPATDGARLFYVARAGDHYDLMQVPVGGGDAQKMAAPFANSLIWDVSPDGSRYLMTGFEARGQPSQLWSWPVTGGPPIKLDDMISGSAVWSPDGKSIAYHIGKELWIGKADGSGKKRLATFPLDVDDPAWSPDGTRIRLTLSDAEKDTRSIWEIRADGNGLRNIIDPSWKLTRVSSGSWTPDGRYFLFADHSEKGSRLFALREKGSWWRRSPAGPFLLASDATGSTAPLIGRSGDRVYFYGEAGFRVELQAMQLATNSVSQLLPGMGAIMPGFSRDGHWVAYERISNGSLWRSKLDGSELRELPTPGIQVAFPRWSPDGKFVAFSGHESPEKTNVYVIRQEGGRPEAIAPGEDNLRDPDWSGDGRVLVMAKTDGNGNGQTNAVDRLVTVDWETRKMESVPDSEGMYLPRWSPDNRWIAAVSDEHHGIAVYDTHRKTWKRLAKGRLLGVPAWTADGRSVYFQDLLESGEPLYKIEVASGKLVKVASFEHELERGASRCAFIALTGDGRPVIAIDRSLPDIYGAALVLP
ncbi:MAG TPA: hypothetical protein VKT53_13675, partial [Candidatus Acidoferrum sp.]|nr:hypothetical protein [Candidatus Acidoferrum sp.]